ncbi:MAG TPA: hypothetical protein DCP90_08125 [Clostridiales bacterium]|nr:MAG: hypothetical protein A2Y22_01265 [Clostridiales bacterium GWD2_32_59]HAN10558.1 hypothetical protein [Clostridiales bacterium]
MKDTRYEVGEVLSEKQKGQFNSMRKRLLETQDFQDFKKSLLEYYEEKLKGFKKNDKEYEVKLLSGIIAMFEKKGAIGKAETIDGVYDALYSFIDGGYREVVKPEEISNDNGVKRHALVCVLNPRLTQEDRLSDCKNRKMEYILRYGDNYFKRINFNKAELLELTNKLSGVEDEEVEAKIIERLKEIDRYSIQVYPEIFKKIGFSSADGDLINKLIYASDPDTLLDYLDVVIKSEKDEKELVNKITIIGKAIQNKNDNIFDISNSKNKAIKTILEGFLLRTEDSLEKKYLDEMNKQIQTYKHEWQRNLINHQINDKFFEMLCGMKGNVENYDTIINSLMPCDDNIRAKVVDMIADNKMDSSVVMESLKARLLDFYNEEPIAGETGNKEGHKYVNDKKHEKVVGIINGAKNVDDIFNNLYTLFVQEYDGKSKLLEDEFLAVMQVTSNNEENIKLCNNKKMKYLMIFGIGGIKWYGSGECFGLAQKLVLAEDKDIDNALIERLKEIDDLYLIIYPQSLLRIGLYSGDKDLEKKIINKAQDDLLEEYAEHLITSVGRDEEETGDLLITIGKNIANFGSNDKKMLGANYILQGHSLKQTEKSEKEYIDDLNKNFRDDRMLEEKLFNKNGNIPSYKDILRDLVSSKKVVRKSIARMLFDNEIQGNNGVINKEFITDLLIDEKIRSYYMDDILSEVTILFRGEAREHKSQKHYYRLCGYTDGELNEYNRELATVLNMLETNDERVYDEKYYYLFVPTGEEENKEEVEKRCQDNMKQLTDEEWEKYVDMVYGPKIDEEKEMQGAQGEYQM